MLRVDQLVKQGGRPAEVGQAGERVGGGRPTQVAEQPAALQGGGQLGGHRLQQAQVTQVEPALGTDSVARRQQAEDGAPGQQRRGHGGLAAGQALVAGLAPRRWRGVAGQVDRELVADRAGVVQGGQLQVLGVQQAPDVLQRLQGAGLLDVQRAEVLDKGVQLLGDLLLRDESTVGAVEHRERGRQQQDDDERADVGEAGSDRHDRHPRPHRRGQGGHDHRLDELASADRHPEQPHQQVQGEHAHDVADQQPEQQGDPQRRPGSSGVRDPRDGQGEHADLQAGQPEVRRRFEPVLPAAQAQRRRGEQPGHQMRHRVDQHDTERERKLDEGHRDVALPAPELQREPGGHDVQRDQDRPGQADLRGQRRRAAEGDREHPQPHDARGE